MKNLKQIATLALAMVVAGTSIPQIALANTAENVQAEAAETEYVVGKKLDMAGYQTKPVFSEEFEGDSLNPEVWNIEAHEPGWVNSEWQEYVDADNASENIVVTDGALNIIPKKIAIQEGNMLANADFSNKMTGWEETIANWGPEWTADATRTTENGKIKYSIKNVGEDEWHVQLKQEVPLEAGKKYRVTFNVKSSKDRVIKAGVQTKTYAPLATEQVPELKANVSQKITINVNDDNQLTVATAGALYISMGKMKDSDGNFMDTNASDIELSDFVFSEIDDKGNPVATTKYEYTSGRINTQNKKTFTYGLFECKAKVPTGKGYLPAFWLMANDENVYGQWPRCGEIDCMEVMGQEPNKLYGTIHYGNPHGESQGTKTLESGSFADDYHLFQCEWLPGRINWYVDGVLYHTENDWHSTTEGKGTLSYPAPFDQPFYIILNLAIGGSWVGYPDETTSFENQAYSIDYVKVYQKDSYDENVTRPEKTENWREPVNGNYVLNGDFANYPFAGVNDWEFKTANGGVATCTAVNKELTITTTDAGTVDYSVQLLQAGVPLKKTAQYKVSFQAKASEERTTGVAVKGGEDRGWEAYFSKGDVALTTDYQTYEYTFTMDKASNANARFEFNMGAAGSTATINIKDVKLEMVKEPDPDADSKKTVLADGNYIYNGEFQEGDKHLGYWTISEGLTASVTGFDDGRRLNAVVNNAGASISQNDLALVGGAHELSFEAEGAGTITVDVAGVTKTIQITADQKNYAVKIELPAEMSSKDFKMTFDTAGTYKIDNIRFVEDSLIKNGSFNAGDTGFEVFTDGSASATHVVDSLNEDNAVDFTINNTSDAEWKIQLKQSNVVVEKDQCYKLSFKIKSSIERTIQYALQRNGAVHKTEAGEEDWTPYAQQTVSLPADVSKYTEVVNYFKMPYDTDEGTIFNIALGGGKITTQHRVCIDDIVLEKIDESQMPAVEEPQQPVNTNLLTNGDFVNGSEGWINGVTDVEASWKFDEGSAKATITNLNNQIGSWRVKLQQSGLTLVKGKTYTVTAKITSDTARTIEFASMDSTNTNWYVQGENKVVFEKNGTKDVKFTVSTGEKNTDTDAYIAFNLGAIDNIETPSASAITIDDVSMMIVEESKPEMPSNPTEPSAPAGSGSGSGSATAPSVPESKPEVIKNPDGTTTETVKETVKNESGKEVATVVTTQKDKDGNVTGSTEVSTIENVAKNTQVTITVEKDASGKVAEAVAEVTKKGTETSAGTKGTISSAVVKQIVEAAGSEDVKITTAVTDAKGNEKYTVAVDAGDLVAGKKLT
ncbi:MAG: carbohydrate binding domain-containing protein, partial [Lachnospiraceae bacterium]|nr:carbohydrate binding domain-containing protein [bacterium]MDY5518582.1 carbohydrate binding domain-containing protein [Lachnospiraceae bacterium]